MNAQQVAQKIAEVRSEIAEFDNITIVAAVKFQPAKLIQAVIASGITELGVNHVQQYDELYSVITERVRWHYIGNIQSRKAKLMPKFDCIQSLDRLSVAKVINEILITANQSLSVLIEVNIAREEQKSGVFPEKLDDFTRAVGELKCLKLKGLMAMPPFLDPPCERARFFQEMRRLFEAYSQFSILSMGTSTDYRVALEEGSTMIRLGTTIFGERHRPSL